MKNELSRRKFIALASGGALATAGPQAAPALGNADASDKVRLGFIGLGGRGGGHLLEFKDRFSRETEIVALCDVDSRRLYEASRAVDGAPAKETDFRKVLDRKDVDAVIIAPPDHWHAIAAVRACEAGKDVYVEKPLGHDIREGRLVADAARKHGRIVATGLQQRSGPHFIEAVKRIQAGEIGKVTFVNAWNAWRPAEMGGGGPGGQATPPDSDPPEGVDYDAWLGPASKAPFNPWRFHFYWYFSWNFSGGMVSDWGVHLFDVVSWALGPDINAVSAEGGKLYFKDLRETPDTASVAFDCPGFTLSYTMRHANGLSLYGDMDHGLDFCGDRGTLRINRKGFELVPENDRAHPVVVREQGMDLHHKKDFLECLRSRRKPRCDAEDGHRSSTFGHLANISLRVGRRIRWDPRAETILDDPQASALLRREYRTPWVL